MSGTAARPDAVAEIARRAHRLWVDERRPEGRAHQALGGDLAPPPPRKR